MTEENKKSGIRTFSPGDNLFQQGDPANSLYIIQKGQVRLFLPKGRGFVELAILRAGEVIGEMAYFDEHMTRRSCSAQALVTTEVIEISFKAFGKTMEGLNPWFKTIINTLADRLRKTNDKVKALEGNSLVYGKEGKVSEYEFFHKADILKLLSLLYLSFKSHAEKTETHYELHLNRIRFYMIEVFGISEVKYEEFFNMLVREKFLVLANDEDNLPKLVQINDVESLRSILVFLNMERLLDENKKIHISEKCESLLKRIMREVAIKKPQEESFKVNLSDILEKAKEAGDHFTEVDLDDAINAALCEEVLVNNDKTLSVNVFHKKLRKVLPPVSFMNAIKRVNELKSH